MHIFQPCSRDVYVTILDIQIIQQNIFAITLSDLFRYANFKVTKDLF